jgi:6-phosphogluconolactonase/glucosamine-6-phosphate isomerase/deaminase
VLGVEGADVVATAEHAGRRRMTLTYGAIAPARAVLWLVAGEAKAPALRRLLAGDASTPAGRVRRDRALVLADASAAGRAP